MLNKVEDIGKAKGTKQIGMKEIYVSIKKIFPFPPSNLSQFPSGSAPVPYTLSFLIPL